MAKYSINYAKIKGQAAEFQGIGTTLAGYETRLTEIVNAMDGRYRGIDELKQQVRDCGKAVSLLAGRASSTSTALTSIVEQYGESEKNNYNAIDAVAIKAVADEGNAFLNALGEWAWETAKEAGYLGQFLSLAEDAYLGFSQKNVFTLGKTAVSIRNFVAEIADDAKKIGKAKRIMSSKGVKTWWTKQIIGGTDYFKKLGKVSRAKSIGTRFKRNLHKAYKQEISKVGWGSVVTAGVSNALSNREEYNSGSISAGRAVQETIVETAVDVVTDVVLTSAAAAAVGAVTVALGTTVGAPVVLVAAVTIGAKMGLNAAAKWATGGEKNFTELASDSMIDLYDNVKDLGSYLGSQTTQVWKGVASQALSDVKGFFSFQN